ncbi:MAG: DinB family protein [Nocardioides sp.]
MSERLDERIRPPEEAGEPETMLGLLDFLRGTVVHKVGGLTDDQAFSTPVASSALTAGGLVKHLTGVERFWFSIDFAGDDLAWPWPDDDPHGNFPIESGDTLDSIVAGYLEEANASRQAVADAGFDDRARGEGMRFNLRYAVAHLVEETARHCGHLDLLREALDGETGE